MTRFMVFVGHLVLSAGLAVIGPVAASDTQGEDSQRSGPRAGDRFTSALSYSNAWEEGELVVANPPTSGRPLTPGQLERIRRNPRGATRFVPAPRRNPGGSSGSVPELRRIPRAEDPLFVDMTVRCEAKDGGLLGLIPRIAQIHYFDDRGRNWTLKPAEPGSGERAAAIIKRAASSWTPELSDEVEREMLEEQLLGAALTFFHRTEIVARLGSATADTVIENFDMLVDENVPTEYPKALRPQIRTFLDSAIARVVTPLSTRLGGMRRGREVESGDVTYKVDKVIRRPDGVRVRATGRSPSDDEGRRYVESLLFDARTGVVIEATSAVFQDRLTGTTSRTGTRRWRSKLTSFQAATKSGEGKPASGR